MIHSMLKDRATKLFIAITAFFVANALIAECIGGKIFSLEKLFGAKPLSFSLLGPARTRIKSYLRCIIMAA